MGTLTICYHTWKHVWPSVLPTTYEDCSKVCRLTPKDAASWERVLACLNLLALGAFAVAFLILMPLQIENVSTHSKWPEKKGLKRAFIFVKIHSGIRTILKEHTSFNPASKKKKTIFCELYRKSPSACPTFARSFVTINMRTYMTFFIFRGCCTWHVVFIAVFLHLRTSVRCNNFINRKIYECAHKSYWTEFVCMNSSSCNVFCSGSARTLNTRNGF
jgi:hypothetical protein